MAQRSKFIGAPSRNEFWEPQEEEDRVPPQENIIDINLIFNGTRVKLASLLVLSRQVGVDIFCVLMYNDINIVIVQVD